MKTRVHKCGFVGEIRRRKGVKPESERGLYSRSFGDVRDAETNAARPLIVIKVELVM